MSIVPPRPPADHWYRHDIYVNFAEPLGDSDRHDVDAAVAAVKAHPGACFDEATSFIGRGDASPPAGGASGDAAIMIVFLTDGFLPGAACWKEAEDFHAAILAGRRSADQLVICELRPYPAERQNSLPWMSDAAASKVGLVPLFNPYTRRAFSSEELVAKNRGLLSNDIARRLARLREVKAAAATALAPPRREGRCGQAYLMEYGDDELWSRTRDQLSRGSDWVIHPAGVPKRATTRQERKLLRQRRQRFLENCQGYLIVRGAATDDLEIVASDANADLREAMVEIPTICIDWIGAPPPAWPAGFRPEIVDARPPAPPADGGHALRPGPAWVRTVRALLATGEEAE